MSGQLGGVCVCHSEAVTVVIDDLPPSPSVVPAFTLCILASMMGETGISVSFNTCPAYDE